MILGFDTATPATTVALIEARTTGSDHLVRTTGSDHLVRTTWSDPVVRAEARHDPAEGERPGHAMQLLALVDEVLGQDGWEGVERIAVGAGPGSFTGLRIGVSTARALAQARGLRVTPVSSLEALALPAREAHPDRAVAALIDARRGEVFAAIWEPDGTARMASVAIAPGALAPSLQGVLAAGDGSVRFRAELEPSGVYIPEDDSPLHRVSAVHVCRLAAEAEAVDPGDVLPDYLRPPDAELRKR